MPTRLRCAAPITPRVPSMNARYLDVLAAGVLGHIGIGISYRDYREALVYEPVDGSPASGIAHRLVLAFVDLYLCDCERAQGSLRQCMATLQMGDLPGEKSLFAPLEAFALSGLCVSALALGKLAPSSEILARAKDAVSRYARHTEGHHTTFLVLLMGLLDGVSQSFSGDQDLARHALTSSLKRVDGLPDSASRHALHSALLTRLATVQLRMQEVNAALDSTRLALEVARLGSYLFGEAEALRRRGIVLSEAGERAAAIEALNAAYERYSLIGNPYGIVESLTSLGRNYSTSEYRHARFCFSKAIEVAKVHGLTPMTGALYSRLGDVCFAEGRFDAAEEFYLQDWSVTTQSEPSGRRRAHALRNLGQTRYAQKKLTLAVGDLSESRRLFESVGDQVSSGLVAMRLCECLLELGRFDECDAIEREARTSLSGRTGPEALLPDMMRGMIYRSRGKLEAAADLLGKALSSQADSEITLSSVRTQLELALTVDGMGQRHEYVRLLKAVVTGARHVRATDLEGRALGLLKTADEREWTRMLNVAYLGVATDSRERQMLDLVVMFSDLRNYTPLAQRMPLAQLADFVNEFFDVVGRVVYDNGGIVNKYIGDCVMSVFGLKSEDSALQSRAVEEAALQAYSTAIQLNRSVRLLGERYEMPESVEVGVGVATGTVAAGYFGNAERMEFSVVGPSVNLASRLQAYADIRRAILCERTASYLLGQPSVEPHGTVECKGFTEPVVAWRLVYPS